MSKESDGDSVYLDSPRAGGKYKITGTAASMLGQLDVMRRALLTTWLSKQRRAGIEYPAITSDTINSVKTLQPLTTTERIERTLLHFNRHVRVGEAIEFRAPPYGGASDPDAQSLMAISETLYLDELIAFLQLLEEMGLLVDKGKAIGNLRYTPTAAGWLRIEELVLQAPSTSQAFVAMWFNDAVLAAYFDGIEPAIRDAGYRAVRIDQKEHNNKIDDEIIAEIRRSKFVVADFTCEKEKVRGGVYYEAGFARGLGIPVISTVSSASLSDVHFDTRQYNHIVWDTPATLRKLLAARIGAVIGDGPLKSAPQ
ncbi:hypothetical protein [Bradyrhizobium zhanjiangense]|uniref:Nucleoside 2-deoxyribosyltransferase n=1 Tax=Bradyrhizobium zhanjiangense TaxID=1325107 RepID=A0A4Q0QQU0_9BRAD|nr:hypothetical protein [Bradyrhizobium zhanjiangense]RXG97359.1 hypothetical protein EAS61_15300 [Bradyrhizobium zhanjiangense]